MRCVPAAAQAATGDIVEAVPGVVATRHSGDGKASHYFLRGFNLDHRADGQIDRD